MINATASQIYRQRLLNIEVQISAGQTTTIPVSTNGGGVTLVGIETDLNFEPASLTFLHSSTGAANSYKILMDPKTYIDAFEIPADVNLAYPVDSNLFAMVQYFKVVSSTTQSVTTTLNLIFGPLWQ
jgi:hypothetical protein